MIIRIFKTAFKVLQGSALSSIVFFASAMPANAGVLSMANTPLFLGAAVQPNVFFVSDDSGSMDWEFMTPAYWRYQNYDPDPIRAGQFLNSNWSNRVTNGRLASPEFNSGDSNNGDFAYVYDNSDSVYVNSCGGSYGRAEACDDNTNHPFDVEWRGRSSALNKIFYNSDIEYQPWDGPCNPAGDACDDASFTAARSDPYSTQDGYDITRNLATDGDADDGPFVYEVWIDDSGYDTDDGYPRRGDRFNETGHASTAFTPVISAGAITSDLPNEEVDLWDSHVKFTVTNAEINVQLIEYNPVPSGASRGLNETVRVDTDISNSSCYNVLGNAAMVKNIRDQILIDPANAVSYINAVNAEGCRTIAETRQNIANWYQYYRRRAFPVKNAIAEVIDAQPNFRFGMTVLNEDDELFIEVPDVSVTNYSAHNTSIKQDYFAFDQPRAGTPLREALYDAGRYFDDTLGKDDPIVYSCQKNFTVLFTDGYWTETSFSSVGNSDGDVRSRTLADVAHHFYAKVDLSPLPDNVKPDLPLEDDLPLYVLDPSNPDEKTTRQHMVTFTVAFGVTGELKDDDDDDLPDFDTNGDAWPDDEVAKNGKWGDPFDSNQEKIDDLWHAAFNSGGVYASASTPTEVSERLIEAISAIAARVGSASAVALNSGTLNANSRLYQARFNSNGWAGDLFSRPLQDGPVDKTGPGGIPDGVDDSPAECNAYPTLGELCDVEWSAAAELATMAPATRKIYTLEDDTYTVVDFKDLGDLGADQQAALKTDPDTLVVGANADGQDRIDYLRGDHSKEADQSGGVFRIRAEVMDYENTTSIGERAVLGDIINSAPAYVGAPDFFYPNTIESKKYTEFKLAQRNRSGVVYAGANDGMLHAFDAETGKEKFAYQPGALIDKLNLLTSVKYNSGHNYYIDGSPTVFDAYDGNWQTLLASSSGAGAQLVFGLNITDPDATNLATALEPWEFTDNPRADVGGTYGDVDLGYTIGDVSFGKMNNGEWAVIFGNGYNNTFPDGNVSTTGDGAIYVVNAFTGALIKKFNTQVGMDEDPLNPGSRRPNGVATVTPVDTDGDFKVDTLYAGDLFGNAWKVDVKSSSPSSWKFAYEASGQPAPFFVAKDVNGDEQPITSALTVKRHPIERSQTLVLFGTGKFFEVGDSASSGAATQIQTFYSIWDNNKQTEINPARSKLLEQEIIQQVSELGVDGVTREFRVTSSEKDDLSYKIDWSTDRGWYMDMRYGTEYGERMVVNPLIRNDRIIFVTQTPDDDPCSAGGTSWIMEISANDGNRLDVPPFDVNGDGYIDDNDVVDYLGKDTITSGVRSKSGIVAQPGILNNNRGDPSEFKYFSGTKGSIDVVTESKNAEFRKRQSWRQLR